jgi:hypothetical protein
VTDAFFEQLDSHFGPDRGEHGEPSATDFVVLELPAIVERFALNFDDLPEIVEGVSAGRMRSPQACSSGSSPSSG